MTTEMVRPKVPVRVVVGVAVAMAVAVVTATAVVTAVTQTGVLLTPAIAEPSMNP
jgi:hypothetical protein